MGLTFVKFIFNIVVIFIWRFIIMRILFLMLFVFCGAMALSDGLTEKERLEKERIDREFNDCMDPINKCRRDKCLGADEIGDWEKQCDDQLRGKLLELKESMEKLKQDMELKLAQSREFSSEATPGRWSASRKLKSDQVKLAASKATGNLQTLKN
jgi:hypothetical protein